MTDDLNEKIEEFEHQMKPQYKALIAVVIGVIGTIIFAWILGGPLSSFMKSIKETYWYHFIPFILSISFFVVLVYKAYIKNIKGLSFLSVAILLHGLAEFFLMISPPTQGQTLYNRGNNIWALIADILFPLVVILLYFHVELMDKLRPDLIHAIGIIGTAIPLIIGGVFLIVLQPFSSAAAFRTQIYELIMIYLGVFAVIILWISLFGFKIMYLTLKHADSPTIARGSVFVLVGFSSLLTNFFLLGGAIIDPNFEVHNTWLLTVALISMLLAYIINVEFAYSVPFDVYQLIIINQYQGITLFSFINEFRQEGKITHDALKSPAIVAIQNLVQEIAHAEGHIILIGMSDRVIVMNSHNEIVSVLITHKNSYFLNKGLQAFTNAFYHEYKDHIVNFNGNVKVFHDATNLIHKHLPFMRRESLTSTG
ncbi:MAG: hypothetical protein OEY49_05060 [Candidatus Heimdallarchaeota archaeon]|nr:hypothetical protein [Candidatus Heimdallarchaeota archaeon]